MNTKPGQRAIKQEFSEMHIQITWQELKDRFGFELKAWKKKFYDYMAKQPAGVDVVGAFFRFGNDRINPILNEILGRSSSFPTFNRLTDYIVKKH